jgi:hypothetical protein
MRTWRLPAARRAAAARLTLDAGRRRVVLVKPGLRRLGSLTAIVAVAYAATASAQDPAPGAAGTTESLTVTITSPPTDQPIPPQGQISFAANKPGASFRCLSETMNEPCTSPAPYGPLEPGKPFTFAVVALLGREKSPEARATYAVATAQPPPALAVTITDAPSGTVAGTSATIAFTASRPGATFRCTLDNVDAACTSPTAYADLSNGTHSFSVVAQDANDVSEPATASWTVSAAGPSPTKAPRAIITAAPEGRVSSRRARLAFTSTAGAARFECSLDRSRFVDCRSPRRYHHLARASHTFVVRAVAANGATGPPAVARWRVAAAPGIMPPSDGGTSWPAVILACLLAAAAAALAAHRILHARRRADWQRQARAEPPDRPCSERNHYCRKVKVKARPGPRVISYLDARARGSDGRQLHRQLGGRLARELNGVVGDYRGDRNRDRLRTAVLPAAGMLLHELDSWPVTEQVTVDAHLVAAEVEYEFTLYVCSKSRDSEPEWEKEDEWTASLADEREESAVKLDRRQPVGVQTESALDQLAELVTNIDEHVSVDVSGEGRLQV